MKSIGEFEKAGFDRIESSEPKENPEENQKVNNSKSDFKS